jgi:hypothetical protein
LRQANYYYYRHHETLSIVVVVGQPLNSRHDNSKVAKFLWKVLLNTSLNRKIGCVRSVSDGIAKAVGLKKTAMGEVVAFSTGGN